MPHKHTRKGEDKSTLDLPPSIIARPLSVSKSANSNGIFTTELSSTTSSRHNAKKRKRNPDAADDTPKAFARLMAFQQGKKLPKSLDDGIKPAKRGKKEKKKNRSSAVHDDEGGDDAPAAEEEEAANGKPAAQEIPKIKVGERMSEFSARVDAALPIAGLINKSGRGGKDPLGLKVGRTKTEKKMHRMYDEWREQDRRIKEKRQEALELADEEAMGEEDGQVKWKAEMEANNAATTEKGGNGKRSKNKKKKMKVIGEKDDGDDDPWAQVKRNRGEAKVGLNDVVQAPPTFAQVPRDKFKVSRAGARVEVDDVPKASGSLRRREELGEVRKSIVDAYRQMMKGKHSES